MKKLLLLVPLVFAAPVLASEVTVGQVCKAVSAAMFGRDLKIMRLDKVESGIAYVSELDQQLKGVSQGVQTTRTMLAERQESDRRQVLSSLETLSSDVPAALVQHLTPLTQAIESLQTSQQALTEAVSQQKSYLEAQSAASQGRFRYVVIIFALFATSTLAYIGYDIWKNLTPCQGEIALRLTLFSGHHFDLTGDERIHFTLYWNQQIDTGLRYMEGDGEVVARFRIIAFQSASCYPLTLFPGKRFGCWEGKGKACRSYILVARALSAGVRFVPRADAGNSCLIYFT